MTGLPAHNDSEETAGEVDNLVPYARFLERRAWRVKIATDHHRLDDEWIEIEPGLTKALAAETCLVVDPRREPVVLHTKDGEWPPV